MDSDNSENNRILSDESYKQLDVLGEELMRLIAHGDQQFGIVRTVTNTLIVCMNQVRKHDKH